VPRPGLGRESLFFLADVRIPPDRRAELAGAHHTDLHWDGMRPDWTKRSGPRPAPERMLYLSAETTMSDPYLPAEILDHVTDRLHDTPGALRNCRLVSKS
jgi:hypothetical protein